MSQIRIIHTADIHADSDPKKKEKLERSLEEIYHYVCLNDINAVIFAGDIWERKQAYLEASGVPLIDYYLRAISEHVDQIFIVKGNNSHDEKGSISLLHQIQKNIYAYEYPVVLAVTKNGVRDLLEDLYKVHEKDENYTTDYIVSLVPYPEKSMFISADSIDNNNAEFIQKFEQIFELIGDTTANYTCPKILTFHGNVVGSRLSSGQSLLTQDILVAPSTLKKAAADYYALGHIHLRQEIAPNMVYSGSIYNKSWGETEQKSFEVLTFTDGILETERVFFTSAKPMVTLDAEFINGELEISNPLEEIEIASLAISEVRLKYKVHESERSLVTPTILSRIQERFSPQIKFEQTIIPDIRESRSEKIMKCKTLLDEVEEYAGIVKVPMTESIREKVRLLQEINNGGSL